MAITLVKLGKESQFFSSLWVYSNKNWTIYKRKSSLDGIENDKKGFSIGLFYLRKKNDFQRKKHSFLYAIISNSRKESKKAEGLDG